MGAVEAWLDISDQANLIDSNEHGVHYNTIIILLSTLEGSYYLRQNVDLNFMGIRWF